MIPGGSVGSQWGWGKGQVLYRNRAEFKKKIIFFKKKTKKNHTINQKNLFLFYSFIFFFEGGGFILFLPSYTERQIVKIF